MITKETNNTFRDNYSLPLNTLSNNSQITLKRIQDYIFNFNDLLGQGNFSKVYKARKDISNQTVAIKIIELNSLKSKKLEELLFSQIEILKRLNHQNVLKCHEIFTSNRNCYIITQLCNQGDLQSKLRAKKQMKQQQAEPYIKAIFRGLVYLGQMGIVHRDLKVANIFIHDGKAKIADFGFAKATRTKFKDINIGSPIYMSPEGFIHNYYGPKTDIWAFGMLIYQLLHGKTPFSHCKSQNQLKYNMSIPIGWSQLKPQLSTQIKQVIMKCLQVDQHKRISVTQLQNLAYFSPKINKNYFNTKFDENQVPHLLVKRNQDILPFNKDYIKRKDLLDTQQFDSKRDLFNQYKNGMKSESTIVPQFKARIQTENVVHNKRTQRDYSSYLTSQKRDDSLYTLMQSKQKFLSIKYNADLDKYNKHRNTASSSNFINSERVNDREGFNKYTLKISGNIESKEDVILSARITFKECVNILHYCRLLFKHLVLMRDLNFGDQNQHNIFKRWLSTILKTLVRDIQQRKIKYEGDNLQARERKLQQVTTQYVKKYTKQLSLDLSKVKLEQSGVINHQKINNYFNSVYQLIDQLITKDRTNQGWLRLGASMIMIVQGSQILKQCFDEKQYTKITKFKQIEEFLSARQQISFIVYQSYKKKYLFS